MSKATLFVVVLCGLSAVSCGGSAPAPEAAPESSPTAGAEPAEVASPDAWSDDLSEEQKIAFMKAKVVPGMAPIFADEADFGCATCHGPKYESPQAYLPKLVFKQGNLTAFAEKPEISKFMAEKVSPEMAKILGKAPYDPATHQGFGCTGCHAVVPQ